VSARGRPRWKGENVSTLEVAEVLSVFPGVKEANVYGVAIPGKDGRACMAACVIDDALDWAELGKHLQKNLPLYAVPIFIRKLAAIEVTGTFKHTKVRTSPCRRIGIADRRIVHSRRPLDLRLEHIPGRPARGRL